MHPILESPRRVLLYLLAWLPIVALLSVMIGASGGAAPALGHAAPRWFDALLVAAPACLVYAFVCLSPWYICRVQPLRLSSLFGLVSTFLAASTAGGLLLMGSARLAASGLQQPTPPWAPLFGTGVLLYLLSVGSHYAALAVEDSRAAERRAAQAQTLAREAELQALRMQLNPHFLFNSLHSISALTTLDGARARELCLRLADFLRSSLRLGDRESIPLREELALARSYLEVEHVRFGERLRVEAQLAPGCEECPVPPLILQPLVENALKHGIAELVEGGAIRLFAERLAGDVRITVENAFDPETPPRPMVSGGGLGLTLVRRRLQVRYGADAAFDAGPDGAVYRVVLRFPCEPPMTSSSRA